MGAVLFRRIGSALSIILLIALGLGPAAGPTFDVTRRVAGIVDPDRGPPGWMDRAVIYGVATPLLGPRGFEAVIDRLDAIAGLGVNTLWLSPVTDAPDGDFGYALTDPFAVRPDLGGEAGLRALIAAAHRHGLRVMLDVVVNHFADRNPYARDVSEHGRGSPYYDFFAHGPDGGFLHYFDWRNLDNLNYSNPKVRTLMTAAFAHWVRDFDVDGFRVDAAWSIRERAPDFWPSWRAALKRLKPDLLLLAEASARDPYYRTHGFDAAYDWTEKLGEWAWGAAFAHQDHVAADLRAALGSDDQAMHSSFRFLNNNDTGPRFASRYGIERTRVAATMLLTLPGLPGIYMGDEVGAAFEPYARPGPIAWLDKEHLQAHYARLIALRQAYPALRSGVLRWIDTVDPDHILAYIRSGPTVEDSLVVLLNYGATDAQIALWGNRAVDTIFQGGDAVDLLSSQRFAVNPARARVPLPAFGARILRRVPPT